MLIGQSDFKIQIENGLYVDKTRIIDELSNLINTSTGVIINRPRRFGKSLMISMLDYFFNADYSSSDLFDGLAISKSKNYQYINKYPVIKLSFKDAANYENKNIINEMYNAISNIYVSYKDKLLPHLNEEDKSYYLSILSSKCNNEDYLKSLNKLATFILNVMGEKPIILIDEYDAPIEKSFATTYYDEIVSFLKALFITTFKDTTNYNFTLLTGVFSITKGTLGSGLNNIPIDNGIICYFNANYFGFNNEDMVVIKTKFNLSDNNVKELYDYYGGYYFNNEYVYNPWSILNYLNNRVIDQYWNNTSSNEALSKMFEKNNIIYSSYLFNLINEGRIMQLDLSNSYDSIFTSDENIVSYLVMAGYLRAQRVDLGEYFVSTPNLETEYAFSQEIHKLYKDKVGLNNALELKQAFKEGNSILLSSLINKYILSSLTYYDFNNEKNYQIMVGTMLSILFSECITKYEVIVGTGRCDILLMPKFSNNFGAVIEIKYIKDRISASRLESSANTAIKQILKNSYVDELLLKEVSNIYAYGIAFSKNRVVVRNNKIK